MMMNTCMSQSESNRQFLIIGNPENRRLTLFQSALAKSGLPSPLILSHLDLIASPERLLEYAHLPLVVRIESVGENFQVQQALLKLGYQDALLAGVSSLCPDEAILQALDPYEVICPRQIHFGFERYFNSLQAVFDRANNWIVMSSPAEVLTLFDKRLTQALYQGNDIPVAGFIKQKRSTRHSESSVFDPDSLRKAMSAMGWNAVVIKLSCGSSASCLGIYYFRADGNEAFMTTLKSLNGKLFNSLKVQSVYRREKIDYLISFLLREGSIIEKLVPKARIGNAFIDCRVLLVDKEPVFTVVRQSRHPITNLHLGGTRGDLTVLERMAGDEAMQQALASCRKVAGLYAGFHLGVDLLFEPDMNKHRIIESNAFGDLLPGLQRNGLSVYEYQIQRIIKKFNIKKA